MNRQTLADATSLHDGAVPIYIMQEIANGSKASDRDAEKTADFLLSRLGKTNLIVKLKALQLIAFCIREGGPVFSEVIREEQAEISAYLQYSGPPEPVMGDERYRRIRVASQEVLVCLNDGNLPRQNSVAPPSGNTWEQPAPAQPPQQYGGSYSDSSYGHQGQQGGGGGGGGYGGPQAPPPAANSQPWGKPATRPAPYIDQPSNSGPSYGNQQPSYGGANQNQGYGGPGGYGGPTNDQNPGYGGSGGGNSYGNSSGQHQSHQPSGLSSWSSPAPAHGAPKAAGSGMWTSTGYQKAAPAAPSYGGGSSVSSRDNRPTVLVGHNLNFPKAPSHGNSSLVGGVGPTSSGGYGGSNTGTYRGASTGTYGGSSSGGYGGNTGNSGFSSAGGYGNNSGGGYGNNMNNGGFGGASNRPTSYGENNLNRMLSGSSSMGFNGGSQADALAGTKLGKAVEGLKKIGVEAKDRWDRRNMDKSIGASLADHDELTAGPNVMDRGYFQPQMQQGAAGRDTSGEYERGMIDNLCASVGLARAPPADALKRFVDLAQTLDAQTISDILLDKLEDTVWQVRLKALHVVLALLESPGSAPYMEFFEDNAGVFEELAADAKPTVASKSTQVLRALGLVDDSTPTPATRKPARASAGVARSTATQSQSSNEVDFLGFDSLSIHPSQQQQQAPPQAVAAPNIFGSPSPAAYAQAAPPPQQEISLLDGFDPVPHPAQGHYHQQQQQQQQPYQQQQQHHHQVLSPRQHQQQPQQEYGDLLPMSPPQQQRQAPLNHPSPASLGDERSKTLSNFGKDLFTIANSPRGQAPAEGERSAFNFM